VIGMPLLIFDLDGTLIDSKLDLAHAANATRAYMGMQPIAHELVYSYVGNGAPVLIRRVLGPEASEQDVRRALDFFIRYYGQHCLDNTVLYPGVKPALDQLRSHSVAMAVLTNKPVRISNHILRGLGLADHFFRVYGGNSFEQKKPDPIGINTLLQETGLQRESAVMVGDSAVDVRTARNAGIRACGVKYGFQPESFSADPPDMLIDDLSELTKHVLRV
jgi:phosphoglycolate phosphatase